MKPFLVWTIACAACATPLASAAQSYVELVPPREHERIYLIADGGFTYAGKEFSSSGPAPLTSGQVGNTRWEGSLNSGPTLAAGGGVMVTRRLGFGVTTTRTAYDDLPVTWTLRWPGASGAQQLGYYWGGTRRKEDGVHIEASYMVYRGRTGTVRLFGGPTRYRVKQLIDHQPTRAQGSWQGGALDHVVHETSDIARWGWGYHAGIDAAKYPWRWSASQKLGLGLIVRYMGGSVEMDNLLTRDTGDTNPFDVGGLQVTAGLRFVF